MVGRIDNEGTCFLLTSNVIDLGIVDNEGQAPDKIWRKSFTIGDVYEIVNLNGCWLILKKWHCTSI